MQKQTFEADTPPNEALAFSDSEQKTDDVTQLGELNATGHVQELERNFGFISICAVGLVTGNIWASFGGSVAVALFNGGPPGVIYEFIAVCIFYWLVAASLAELASSLPSSGGVYHWASITPGLRIGRVVGFFAGYLNFFAWIFGAASTSSILGNIVVQMYALYHPLFEPKAWHVFIAYILGTWLCCCIVLFGNRLLPLINNIGLFFILGGVFVTILVCAIMPSRNGAGYVSNEFVWKDWNNATGYDNEGFVFLLGMLNGAYSVGTPDCVTHLAEEIPRPRSNVPKAIAAQMIIGFITALCYMIAMFYSINDLDAILAYNFPLAGIYLQATGSSAGSLGLLVVILLPIICCCIGCYITAGRTFWALARDKATPFSGTLSHVSARFENPFAATLGCGIIVTVLGCIYVGSATAFNAFVGSFVVLSSLSYLAAILPFLLTRRFSNQNGLLRPGPFAMKGVLGYLVNGISCAYIIVFVVIFLFPFSKPVTVQNMNYAVVITGGLMFLVAVWWFASARRKYKGPGAVTLAAMEGGRVAQL